MLRVRPSFTLEFESGSKISLGIEESKELLKQLTKFIENGNHSARHERNRIGSEEGKNNQIHGMSEAKRTQILKYVNKKLSRQPKTLSNLLIGVSYIPNHLPMIREMVESQENISKKIIGKRTYYFIEAGPMKFSKAGAVAA